jgi:hypothetical protein
MKDMHSELQQLDSLLARGFDDVSTASEVIQLAEFHATPVPSVLAIARDQKCSLMDVHEERGWRDGIVHVFTFVKN